MMSSASDLISFHLEKALEFFSKGDYYHSLLNAKEEYFSHTGKINEDEEHFEQKMNLFNDWYLFNYHLESKEKSPIEIYGQSLEDQALAKALAEVKFSVFEYTKNSLRAEPILKDEIWGTKYTLKKEGAGPGIVKGDLFITGVFTYNNSTELTDGLCLLPIRAAGGIRKQCKKIFKLGDEKRIQSFLLDLIKLTNKSANYSHVDATKIFIF
jgi:hypothetical protein